MSFPTLLAATLVAALVGSFALAAPAPGSCADKGQPKRQTITIAFDAPATNYKVRIEGVYKVGDELWVVSRVSSKGIGGDAITNISDSVTIEPTELPVKHKVLGKSWKWGEDDDTIQYVPKKDEAALTEKLKTAEKVAFKR